MGQDTLKIIAIVQARSSSSRLPNKVLKSILGTPMIIHLLKRVNKSKNINKLILATSTDRTDDKLVNIVSKYNFQTYRGSLRDVLKRFNDCAKKENADAIVRITGDCPLIDYELIDEIINEFKKENLDYIGNSIDSNRLTVPDGFDIEVFKSWLLFEASEKALLLSEREHVTPWMRRSNSKIKWRHYEHKKKFPYYRLTVDDANDLKVIKKIFNKLYPKNPYFCLKDIIDFLIKNPEISNINIDTVRNEGYIKSLKNDELLKLE